jgi:hypothetical protein
MLTTTVRTIDAMGRIILNPLIFDKKRLSAGSGVSKKVTGVSLCIGKCDLKSRAESRVMSVVFALHTRQSWTKDHRQSREGLGQVRFVPRFLKNPSVRASNCERKNFGFR